MEVYVKSRTGYPKVRGDCPFSHRVLLTITLKKIPHQVKLIDLKNKPAWFVDAFPKAEVPVVHFPEGRKEGPEWVSGSDTICDVLEKEYPEPSLRLAQGKEAEVGSKIFGSFVKFVTNADPGKEAELKDALLAEIKSLDAYLRENEGDYLGGARVCSVDVALYPKVKHVCVAAEHYKELQLRKTFSAMDAWMKAFEESVETEDTYYPDEFIVEGWGPKVGLPVKL
mmetsp:Transcript_1993/g.7287  ORF Transcript_1993/g.7287 Transcript_1993/m.7287 type:complete len:225 (-) Transcript_1993:24-698(-)